MAGLLRTTSPGSFNSVRVTFICRWQFPERSWTSWGRIPLSLAWWVVSCIRLPCLVPPMFPSLVVKLRHLRIATLGQRGGRLGRQLMYPPVVLVLLGSERFVIAIRLSAVDRHLARTPTTADPFVLPGFSRL